MKKIRFRNVKQGKIKQNSKTIKEENLNFIKKSDYFKVILTDSFMLWMAILYIVFYLVFGSREGFAKHMGLGWIYILSSLTIIEILFLYFKAQTPGMKAYNIKLISKKNKEKASLVQIIIRQIFSKISFFTFLWIIALFGKRVRTLQDLIAQTELVYDKD